MRRPGWTVGAVAVVSVAFAALALQASTDNTPSAWLPNDDAARATYAKFRGRFGGDTFLLVATRGVEVGAPETLAALHELAARLEAIEGVVRVESPVRKRGRLDEARASLDADLKLLADAAGAAAAAVPPPAKRPATSLAAHSAHELRELQAEANASLAFLLFDGEEHAAKAAALYRTAQSAALGAIEAYPGQPWLKLGRVAQALRAGRPLPPKLKIPDGLLTSLFWWAFARGGETRARPRDTKLVADLKRVDAVMRRVLKRAPETFGGGPHLYFAMRNLAVGRGLGGKPAVAKEHFAAVAELTPRALLPKVLQARFLAPTLAATPRGSSMEQVEAALKAAWEAFDGPLRAAITAPLPAGADDATQLADAAARVMARALLADPAEAGVLVPDGVEETDPPPLPAYELRAGPAARFLISPRGDRASLLVVPQPDLAPGPRAALVEAVEAELARTSGLKLDLAGPELITHDLDVASQRSFGLLFPVVLVLMAGVLLYALRSPRVVVGILVCAGLTVVWTMGSLVLAGRTLNLILVVLPAILAVLTTAYSLHLVTRYLHPEEAATAPEDWEARVAAWALAARRTVRPCLLTALTTAAGFGSLAFSEIPPVRDLGLFAGLGVLISFGLTFTLLPAALALSARVLPRGAEEPGFWTAARARGYTTRLQRHAAIVVFVFVVLGLQSLVGIGKLRYESHVLQFFPDDHRLPQAYARIEPSLFGMTPLELWLTAPSLEQLDASRIFGLNNALLRVREAAPKLVTRTLGPLPDRALSAETVARLLRVRLQEQGGAPGFLVHEDGRVDLRVMVACKTTSSEEFHRLVEELRRSLPQSLRLTGAVPLLVRTQALLVETQLRSFGMALLVVTLILLFTYRSLKLVLVSLLPNVLPIAITLGAMGALGIPLNTATVTVAGIALGLVVHDTIHFLHHQHHLRLAGATAAQSVAGTLEVVGRPIATTTLAVALGFGAFAVSDFQPTHFFGLLIAVTCVSALVCDLVGLPALLLLGYRGMVDDDEAPLEASVPEAEPEPAAPQIPVDDPAAEA